MGRTRSRTSIYEYTPWSMIGKSGYGSSEKIMRKQKLEWDDDFMRRHPAPASSPLHRCSRCPRGRQRPCAGNAPTSGIRKARERHVGNRLPNETMNWNSRYSADKVQPARGLRAERLRRAVE